ncbi:MAG TPA: ATPase, partial [Ruminococcaceae bacterium]|nr:ATPase [Oscillospiraceae bacterium]
TIPRDREELETGMTFCGLIGMADPPRPEARGAVALCKRAGIRPIMITGDHAATAAAVAAQLGIAESRGDVLTGPELSRLSDAELKRNIYRYRVFARVSPEHKVRIVRAFQARGEVVAMTGDGVNDAPALRAADIGCAMGISGTEVAKAASDMILTDDNFATIVAAVREGRGIYENIKKTVHFLLSCNIGEILSVFVGFLLRLPFPLQPIQLLWVNL